LVEAGGAGFAGGKQLALGSVAHVGIGEVFVIAGQSNSANHGQEKQTTKTRRVASFDGKAWRIADDPQPGASGGGGSLVPAFADAVVAKENVPVGILACGIGATSVREWLPKGATFPNPPTLVSRVEQLPNGQWASKGAAYEAFIARMKSVGPQGFRAVLWHQGESDANQKDTTRTLPGKLYREHLEKIIRDSRRDIGWSAPWFVAQASYHVPGDEGSDDIRAAQASLWKDGIAFEGPDSDALKGKLRERDGKGVHFSGEGLRVHGAKWAEKVLPWLAKQWTEPRQTNDGTEWSDFAQLPECHSLGWVSANVQTKDTKSWNGVLDEAKWGTPDPQQVVSRNWDWKVSEAQWREAVKQKGEGRREEVRFDLWLPKDLQTARGIVVMSGHGSGEGLFKRADLRKLAQELGLALFKFTGNPMQRGFWPQSLLFEHLRQLAKKAAIPSCSTRRSFSTATRTAPASPPFSRRMCRIACGAGFRCVRAPRFRCISPVPRKCPASSSSARTILSSRDLPKRKTSPSCPRCAKTIAPSGTSPSSPRPATAPARRPGRSCSAFCATPSPPASPPMPMPKTAP
jgi:hypothetical protein